MNPAPNLRVATKLGLAEWLEHCAAENGRYDNPADRRAAHNFQAAAYALRKLTDEQEIDMLEFQVGGPDGIGADSYENPITIGIIPNHAVVIWGPPGSGKSTHAEKFREHFGMLRVIDDVPYKKIRQEPGTLYLMQRHPPLVIRGTKVFHISDAREAVGLERSKRYEK